MMARHPQFNIEPMDWQYMSSQKAELILGHQSFLKAGRSKIWPKLKLEKSPKEKGLINSEAEFLKRNQPIELI